MIRGRIQRMPLGWRWALGLGLAFVCAIVGTWPNLWSSGGPVFVFLGIGPLLSAALVRSIWGVLAVPIAALSGTLLINVAYQVAMEGLGSVVFPGDMDILIMVGQLLLVAAALGTAIGMYLGQRGGTHHG